MKFVTTVIILLLHLPGFAQISINVYAHLTASGSIGTLSFDKTMSLSTAVFSAPGGPVYKATVNQLPPFVLYRNDVRIGTVSSSRVYPISSIRGDLQFYGDVSNTGYFSVRYVYEMAAPHQVSAGVSSATQTCANTAIILRSSDNWPLFSDNNLSTSVIWEYNLNGSPAWVGLDSASADFNFSFVPSLYMPVTGILNVRFRCRIKADYTDKVYYSPYSTASDFYTIIPAPPTLKSTSALVITPACAGKANGKIYLSGSAISSNDPFMYWLLRPGNVTTPCTTNCGDLVDWSNGIDSVAKGVLVKGVAAGTYTLWLINSGGNAGNCLTPIKIVVPEVPALSLSVTSVTHIGCHGAKDGVISIQAAGGGGYNYTLKTPAGEEINNTTGYWKDLTSGTYQAMVSDTTCNDMKSISITLTEPPALVSTINVFGVTCSLPADGRIDIAAPGAIIALYNEEGVPQSSFSGLPAGNYTIRLSDNDHPACPSRDTTVALTAPIPLSLQLIKIDSVSCHGANDGRLQVAGNGSGNRFLLSGPVQMTNTTGDFDHLPAGEYTVQVKRNNPACNDVLSCQYTIYERPPLQVTIQTGPITCYNAANGHMQAHVKGGTGVYHYTWEKLRQPNWFATGSQVEEVEPGTYSVTITDNECNITSDTVVITNPLPLTIDEVRIKEAICLEDGAAFDITASGGDGRYTFDYSWDHGEIYSPLAQIHTSGEYDIRVTDGQGCMAWAPDTYTIHLPDSLYFQVDLTNITCRGNDDGRIDISASGNAYSLSYSLDNSDWQESAVFDRLLAGDYMVYVIDDGGCTKSMAVKLSEDTTRPPLEIKVTGSNGVYCGGDTTGAINFAASGGMAPYKYSLDDTNWATNSYFSGLSAGTYTIRAKDAYGCAAKYPFLITAEDPVIHLSAVVTPVQCYGSSTGELNVAVAGGDGIYHYSWLESSLSTGNLTQLKSGEYHLSVTDGKGCMQSALYTVPQPPPLTMHINTTGVCDGLRDGVIKVLANGGTMNYAYSLGDANWTYDSLFTHLAPGDYTVVIKDANDCLLEEKTILSKKNIQPTVNFLVVSQDNVADTLAVREICLPAPDSVNWEFSPSAEWLGTDSFDAPLIRFSHQGDYWIKMYATFGSCTYTLQKDVNILPFDPLVIPVYQLPSSIIDTVTVSPNPNYGYFKFKVQLNKKQPAIVTVYDLNGRLIDRKQYSPVLLVEDSFDLKNVLPGMYLLRVLTENDSKDVPFIISQI
ncbi:T9SS type A sorting domain-containing protein [Chitinophaga sp.]|uniref:T9SS type A sorting domain-containing protein n=1 Tax=Chitinophaga sp. TaxID=1869181 RepID=UPI0031E30287